MAKKTVKFLVFAVMSIIVGLGINYYVTSELIMIYFMGSERLYPIVVIFALIIQILAVFVIFCIIDNRKCPKSLLKLLTVCYIAFMVVLLFGRPVVGHLYNINILELFNWETLILNIFNFLFFMPIGFFFKNKNWKLILITAFALVFAIEIIQFITERGVLDIVDIVLNTAGIIVGYIVSMHIIKSKKENY